MIRKKLSFKGQCTPMPPSYVCHTFPSLAFIGRHVEPRKDGDKPGQPYELGQRDNQRLVGNTAFFNGKAT